jgi:hypothetical protein
MYNYQSIFQEWNWGSLEENSYYFRLLVVYFQGAFFHVLSA